MCFVVAPAVPHILAAAARVLAVVAGKAVAADKVRVESETTRQEIGSDGKINLEARDGKVRFTLSPVGGAARVCGLTLEAVE